MIINFIFDHIILRGILLHKNTFRSEMVLDYLYGIDIFRTYLVRYFHSRGLFSDVMRGFLLVRMMVGREKIL